MLCYGKPLPVGIDNFEDIISNGYCYVDKIWFIKALRSQSGKQLTKCTQKYPGAEQYLIQMQKRVRSTLIAFLFPAYYLNISLILLLYNCDVS